MTRKSDTIIWAMLGAGLVLMLAGAVYGHEAPSGLWRYDPWCCNERDCAPIPPQSVRVVPGVGYEVTLAPGQHPSITVQRSWIVAFAEARPSGDSEHHACILPHVEHVMRCLHVPPAGM